MRSKWLGRVSGVATSINKTKQNCGGIFSLFLTGVGVYVGAYVCIRTHTHTLHVRYSDVSPGVRTRHLESPKNPGGLHLGIYVFVYVYKVHMYINMLGGGKRSLTNCLFL